MDVYNIDIYKLLGEPTILRGIAFLLGFTVIYFTLSAIVINFFHWIGQLYKNYKDGWFQLTYPEKDEKIIKIKYHPYIVGFPGGEIFYVDEKKLKKLKRLHMVSWDDGIKKYIFNDNHTDEIVNLIKPLIEIVK